MNSGHRFRLRERFLRTGMAGMSEHELLELLLFYAIARKDVKPLAKSLLRRFGTMEAVFAATPEQLLQIDGVGPHLVVLIKLVMTIGVDLMSKPLREGLDLENPEKLQKYLLMNCHNTDDEVLDLLLLDHKFRLLDTLSFTGSSKNIFLSPDDLKFKIYCCRGCRQVILVHNHPGGELVPSKSDILATLEVKEVLDEMSITLLDHFIVTNHGCMSLMKMSAPEK